MTKKQPQQVLAATPREFNKLGDVTTLASMSLAKITTYYYDLRKFSFPLTPGEAAQQFDRNIPVFGVSGGVEPGCERNTNAATGSGVNEIFLAVAAGILAMGEGEAFAVNGALVPRPAAPAPSPAVPLFLSNGVGVSGCYCGVVDLAAGVPNGTRQATLWWGAPTWRFIEKFFQAYRFQVLVGHRFLVLDESLFDIGMTPVPPEFVGASDSCVPTQPFIRATNDVMADKGIPEVFTAANVLAADGSQCLPAPCAPVTYGHPRIIGLANRMYCFTQPILFLPGMRFETQFFNVEDSSCYRALIDSITLNCTTPDETFQPGLAGVETSAGCGVTCTVPGGQVSLGAVFKGVALWPQACMHYLSNFLVQGSAYSAMYSESATLMGLLGNPDVKKDLRGRVAGLLGKPEAASE